MKRNKIAAIILTAGLLAGCASVSDADAPDTRTPNPTAAVQAPVPAERTDSEASAAAVPPSGEAVTGELTVSCFDTAGSKPYFEEAARLFEANHPGTSITVESFSSPPEMKTMEIDGQEFTVSSTPDNREQEKADYISRTNVEIMSGKAADIFDLDILPFYKYTSSGFFENFKEYMAADGDFALSDYRTGIFNSLTYDGVQGVMPIDFRFSYFVYDSTFFTEDERARLDRMDGASFEELVEFGKEAFGRANAASEEPIFMFDYPADMSMALSLFDENYSTFLDVTGKRADFTDGRFAELLRSVKAYGEAGYMPVSHETMGEAKRVMFKENISSMLFRHFSDDPFRLGMLGTSTDKIQDDDRVIGPVTNAAGEAAFELGKSVAINANSPNKRLAWEFVKFLLSYEMQTSAWVFYTPVHKEALAEKTRLLLTGQLWEMEDAVAELDGQGLSELDAYLTAADELIARLNSYFIKDETVTGMVRDEIGAYYENSGRTEEELGSAIENKLFLYLNE